MTKTGALHKFWSSFGIPAYEENSVPTTPERRAEFFAEQGREFPYITYQVSTGSAGDTVSMTASIWDRDRDGYSANLANNRRAEEISRKISMGGHLEAYDGGVIWIKRGSPFAQKTGEPDDDRVKRTLLNIAAEFVSAD